jgi:hypothetical protein
MLLKLPYYSVSIEVTEAKSVSNAHPLSLNIPALLMRIVTPPKESTAVLMTAAPSVTEDELITAFPPAKFDVTHMSHQAIDRTNTTDLSLSHPQLSEQPVH